MGLGKLREAHKIAGERQVLVTEVTRMSGDLVCVAALDIHSGRMVRPLQGDGSNWEEAKWTQAGYMVVGNVLSLVSAAQGNPAYPHASEDHRVATVRLLGAATQSELYEACRETADGDVDSIFGGELVDGKYVVADQKCRSLGCIMIPSSKLKASEFYGKVQVSYRDGQGVWHNFPVTELATKSVGDAVSGAAALNARLAAASFFKPVAVRLGLARAWDGGAKAYDPKRCYLQANGIIVSGS